MKHLIAVSFILLVNSSQGSAQESTPLEEFRAKVVRLLSVGGPPEQQVELGLECLDHLKAHPEENTEREIHITVAVSLVTLEQFRDAQTHIRLAEALSRSTKDNNDLAHCLWLRGVAGFHLGEFDDGIQGSTEGAKLAREIHRLDILWRTENVLGLIQERRGEYEEALDAFKRGLDAAKEIDDRSAVATLKGNLGLAQMNLNEYGVARELFQSVYDLQVDSSDQSGLASTLANLGDVNLLDGEFDAAMNYHLEALELRQKLGSELELSLSYHSLGIAAHEMGEYQEALSYFEKALEIRDRLMLAPERAITLSALARTYAELDRGDEALELAQRGMDATQDLQLRGRQLAVLETLASVYETQGRFPEAIEAYRKATRLDREQRNLSAKREFAKYRAELEAEEKEREISLLTKERELQDVMLKRQGLIQLITWLGSAALIIAAIAGWHAWAKLRRSNAELEAVHGSLRHAFAQIRRLEGILPICSHCKSVRDPSGTWQPLELYVIAHSEAAISHGICPPCMEEHHPSLEAKSPGGPNLERPPL